jgi:hypothetical protein
MKVFPQGMAENDRLAVSMRVKQRRRSGAGKLAVAERDPAQFIDQHTGHRRKPKRNDGRRLTNDYYPRIPAPMHPIV